jgi:hypothetical protein
MDEQNRDTPEEPAIVSGFKAKGITDFDQDAAQMHGLPGNRRHPELA